MENASKALIIAGAILISIVIISLGIVVVNNVRDTVNSGNIDSEEAQAFNGKFTLGEHLTGSQVNAMLQTVIGQNAANRDDTDYTMIIVDASGTSSYVGQKVAASTEYAGVTATIPEGDTYVKCTFNKSKYFNVTATKYAKNGYICEITIQETSAASAPAPSNPSNPSNP